MSTTAAGRSSDSILRMRCPGMGKDLWRGPGILRKPGVGGTKDPLRIGVPGRCESGVFSPAEDQALGVLTEGGVLSSEAFSDGEPVRDVLFRARIRPCRGGDERLADSTRTRVTLRQWDGGDGVGVRPNDAGPGSSDRTGVEVSRSLRLLRHDGRSGGPGGVPHPVALPRIGGAGEIEVLDQLSDLLGGRHLRQEAFDAGG